VLPDARLVGMDAYHAGLLHARGRTDARLVEGRIEKMPFGRTFDLVGLFDVLEHIEDDLQALQGIKQALEPGGRLVLTVPAGPSLWSRYDEESGHQRRYRERDLRAVLTAARFQVEYLTHFMSVIYGPVWLSRRLDGWFNRPRPRSSDGVSPAIERELRIPGPLNVMFGELLRFEVPIVRRHHRVPWGTSLLAIAQAS
jgi:SAM-dependent methyltransferase